MLIYKDVRNKVIQELRLAKPCFYLHVMNETRGNNKYIWKKINNLTRWEEYIFGDFLAQSSGKIDCR